MSDLIDRQQAIDAVKKNTFRLKFVEEQNYESSLAWSTKAVYSELMEEALSDLPSIQPTSSDCISRQAALNLFPDDNLYWDTNEGYFAPHYARTLLKNLPSIQPERKGRWAVKKGELKGELAIWDMCSECKKTVMHRVPFYNYCPNCGADMRGEENE